MDDAGGGGGGIPRRGLRAVGARLGRGRLDPHAVRVRRPRPVPLVLPVAGHRIGPRGEPLLLDGALPPDRRQPAGADVRHRAQPAARPGDVDLGARCLAQRRLDADPRHHGLHRLRGDPALGLLDSGRLLGRVALRLLAVRVDEPRVRPPDDGCADAAPAHPGRPRRDHRPPAAQPCLGRGRPRAARLRAVLPLLGAPGDHRPGRRRLSAGSGDRRPGRRPGHGAAAGAPRRQGTGRRTGRRCRAPRLAGVVRARWAGAPLGPGVAQRGGDRRLHPLELRVRRLPRSPQRLHCPGRVRGCTARVSGVSRLGVHRRPAGRHGGFPARPAPVVLRLLARSSVSCARWGSGTASGSRHGSSPSSR